MERRVPTKNIAKVNQVSNSLQQKYGNNENFKQLSLDFISVLIFEESHDSIVTLEKEEGLAVEVLVLSLDGPI